MNRHVQIIEAMGLGPVWQARPGCFDDHPAAHPVRAEMQTPPLPDCAAPEMATESVAATPVPPAQTEPQNDTPAEAVVTPPMPRVEVADFSELQQMVSACTRCPLCKTRTQTVFGRGNPQARWLLIGEAPGEQEDRHGLPFVGRAGRLLDNMLSAAGLSSEHDVYIANVLKCRPPGNRNPAPQEIAACQDYLHQQIRHIQPDIIVALGRFAAQTLLTSDQSISRLRGTVHQYQGIALVVSYHPAYLLRNPPDKARAWEDWQLARKVISSRRSS